MVRKTESFFMEGTIMPIEPGEIIKPYTTTGASRILVLCPKERPRLGEYIRDFIDLFDLRPDWVTVQGVNEGTPAEFVARAMEVLRYGAFRSRQGEPGTTEVWIACDIGNDSKLREFIRLTRRQPAIHIVPSRPCFELWLLRHFPERIRMLNEGRCSMNRPELVALWEEQRNDCRREPVNALTDPDTVIGALRMNWPVGSGQPDHRCRTYLPELLVRLLLLRYTPGEAYSRFGLNLDIGGASAGSLFQGLAVNELFPQGSEQGPDATARPLAPSALFWQRLPELPDAPGDLVRNFALSPDSKIIILCEGEKTEVNYVEGLIRRFGLPKNRIVVKHPRFCSPIMLVRQAARMLIHENLTNERGRQRFTEAWLIFDRDDHASFEEALSYSRYCPNIHLAVSDPCIELWFLHHRTARRRRFSRGPAGVSEPRNCLRALQEQVPGYKKNLDLIVEKLGSNGLHAAMQCDWPIGEKQPDRSHCWTLMPELVVRLLLMRYPPEEAIAKLGLKQIPLGLSGQLCTSGVSGGEIPFEPASVNLTNKPQHRKVKNKGGRELGFTPCGPVIYDWALSLAA